MATKEQRDLVRSWLRDSEWDSADSSALLAVLHDSELVGEVLNLVSGLSWCVGALEGLGHPSKYAQDILDQAREKLNG